MPRRSRSRVHGKSAATPSDFHDTRSHMHHDLRRDIAQAAARLIEEGQTDYRAAKLKAARQLGVDNAFALPDNHEIEAALSQRQQLFGTQHRADLAAIRAAAADAMQWLQDFHPWISGPVLTGTATRFMPIELEIVEADEKGFAFFLLNAGIDANVRPILHHDGKIAGHCYAFSWQETPIEVTWLPTQSARGRLFNADSLRHKRATRNELLTIMAAARPTSV